MVEIVHADSLNGTNQQQKRRLHILTLLTDQPLWKKRIATHFDVSVQTIGRDVDALHTDGLLTHTFVEADHGSRHYIAYTTTETGRDALTQYRVCTACGDVVDPEQDCVHDYVPLSEYDRGDTEGGD